MSPQKDTTTLVCLFHHQDHAQAAINNLRQAGINDSLITTIGGPQAGSNAFEKSELASLGMPDKDYDHLKHGIRDGGVVVAVEALAKQADVVEKIFHEHSAKQIDEAQRSTQNAPAAPVAAAPALAENLQGDTAIPVVEEELVVGKRQVDQGGVRVYRRVVEIPVEESVSLREEHVVMEHRPVDRVVTDSDVAFGNRTIELTETAEEVVLSKNARVVEEVLVGKTATDHVETVHDTVRRTEVEIEQLPAHDSLIIDKRS
ncbi:MAG: YsnF/AvaK domain-containing protein [Janthinobacterium lividum]